MSITTSEYEGILREYEARRLEEEKALQNRRAEVIRKIPAIAEIDEQLVHGSMQAARLALQGNDSALQALPRTNEWLIRQKQQLLAGAGYSADYLELHYTCPLCHDTGIETVRNADGTEERRTCRCFRRAIIERYYMDDGLRQRLAKENFQTFRLDYYSSKKVDASTGQTHRAVAEDALGEAKAFAANFGKEYSNLLLGGEGGVGKTFLANCIAGELLKKGFSVLYLSSFELFRTFENYRCFNDETRRQAERAVDNVLDCDLLIIDDLGTETANAYTTGQLFVCLEERDRDRKPTVISTNLAIDEIARRYSERIASRLMLFRFLRLFTDDIRVQSVM